MFYELPATARSADTIPWRGVSVVGIDGRERFTVTRAALARAARVSTRSVKRTVLTADGGLGIDIETGNATSIRPVVVTADGRVRRLGRPLRRVRLVRSTPGRSGHHHFIYAERRRKPGRLWYVDRTGRRGTPISVRAAHDLYRTAPWWTDGREAMWKAVNRDGVPVGTSTITGLNRLALRARHTPRYWR